jgi:hypothetical protein
MQAMAAPASWYLLGVIGMHAVTRNLMTEAG